jgi:hypothetical protein
MLHCGAAAAPADAEYPALVLPGRLPDPAPAAPGQRAAPSTAAAQPPAAAGAAPDATGASSAVGASAGTSGSSGAGAGREGAGSEPAEPSTAEATANAAGLHAAQPSPDSEPAQRLHGDLPDPRPLSERAQWSYPITYDRGTVSAGVPAPLCLPRAQATARRFGRFAFELWLGRELVDRVRFDFPLLAAEEPAPAAPRPIHDTPRFAPGARVALTLRVPASERATRASILDRATGEVIDVTWPPRAASGAPLVRPCAAPSTRR